uniref:Uncharacterized protein n=1 Tax=Anguilla anguilla TaxID=7936 RepID=A0A0E9S6G4_ANGAN
MHCRALLRNKNSPVLTGNLSFTVQHKISPKYICKSVYVFLSVE